MTTITTNLNNYSGEEMTVSMKGGKFEMYGYEFTIGEFVEVYKGEGYRKLEGSDWSEPLTTLMLDSNSDAEALRAAVIYVANRI